MRSVAEIREASTFLQGLYDAGDLFPARALPVASSPTLPASGIALAVSPNPSTGRAAVSFTLADHADVHVTLVDVIGRTVRVLADGPRGSGDHRAEVDVAGLAAGIYRVVAQVDGERMSVPLTVAR